MKINILYQPLNKKECLRGWLLAPVYILLGLLLAVKHYTLFSLIALLFTVGAVFLMRDFFKKALENTSLLGNRIWIWPFFATIFYLVLSTFVNDIFMLLEAPYFIYTDWGPILYNIRAHVVSRQDWFWTCVLILVLVMPVLEELIFRQWIFSILYPKSKTLAIVTSVILYAAFHCIGFIGMLDPVHFGMFTAQYIFLGVFLCWMYCSNETIVSPILMHMLCNAIVARNAWTYINL